MNMKRSKFDFAEMAKEMVVVVMVVMVVVAAAAAVVVVAVVVVAAAAVHHGSKLCDIETLNYTFSHELGSERSEQASKRVSAAEGGIKASSAEQANE